VLDSRKRWIPYVSAALLASLTIRVFSELQDFGPESAIREYLDSIQTPEVQRSIKGRNDPESAMVRILSYWLANGVSIKIDRIERSGNDARAAVVFLFPGHDQLIWMPVWVVHRTEKSWLVDANKTATIFWDSKPPNYIPLR
jgi:hypothetical protein